MIALSPARYPRRCLRPERIGREKHSRLRAVNAHQSAPSPLARAFTSSACDSAPLRTGDGAADAEPVHRWWTLAGSAAQARRRSKMSIPAPVRKCTLQGNLTQPILLKSLSTRIQTQRSRSPANPGPRWRNLSRVTAHEIWLSPELVSQRTDLRRRGVQIVLRSLCYGAGRVATTKTFLGPENVILHQIMAAGEPVRPVGGRRRGYRSVRQSHVSPTSTYKPLKSCLALWVAGRVLRKCCVARLGALYMLMVTALARECGWGCKTLSSLRSLLSTIRAVRNQILDFDDQL